MSSPSLYRRHRPRTFSDVVGQESITRTLRNAIDRQSVHHAYLFVGSRGTGKTSMAKILAAALNCEASEGADPCGTCDSCVSIADGTSLDVVEMDAASNNSVDDIRDLRERVALASISGRTKVYVLDEAHMLTPQAWNAFLKTLEEPPPSTVFVLATTEAHKVLATVVDRCHRFDFKRPSAAEIAEVVSRVAVAEGIDAPPAAVQLIATSASGSFRDALGTLEQLSTYAGEGAAISLGDALDVLGVVDAELRFEALDSVIANDPAGAVRAAAGISESGRDLRLFLDDLEAHSRGLLLVELADEVPIELSVSPDQDKRLAGQAKALGRRRTIGMLDLIAEAKAAIRDGADARVRLELLLVKAAEGEGGDNESLAARLDRLEERVAGGGSRTRPAPEVAPAAEEASPTEAQEAVEVTSPQPPSPEMKAAAAPLDSSTTASPIRAESVEKGGAASALRALPDPVPVEAVSPPQSFGAPSLEETVALWPEVVSALRTDSPMVAALLERARPSAVTDEVVTIEFPTDADFHRRKADDQRCREAITACFVEITGTRPKLEFVLGEGLPSVAEELLGEDELVARLVSDFGGSEIDVSEAPSQPAAAEAPEAPETAD